MKNSKEQQYVFIPTAYDSGFALPIEMFADFVKGSIGLQETYENGEYSYALSSSTKTFKLIQESDIVVAKVGAKLNV